MDLSLTSSQILIRDSARSFVRRHVPRTELVRQAKEGQIWDPGWFAHFRDAGWTGALVPEALGGMGLDPLSVALIFEELGRGAVPSPLLASSAIATSLLPACQPSERRDAALTAIANGDMILIPALRKPATSWNGVAATCTALTQNGRNWVLAGNKVFVPFADAASHFLVSVMTSTGATPALAIVPANTAGITTRLLPGFLQANHEVSFDNVAVAETDIVRAGDRTFDDALAVARVVTAAYQVGGMLEMLDMSVAHSNTRVQFGTPIGRWAHRAGSGGGWPMHWTGRAACDRSGTSIPGSPRWRPPHSARGIPVLHWRQTGRDYRKPHPLTIHEPRHRECGRAWGIQNGGKSR